MVQIIVDGKGLSGLDLKTDPGVLIVYAGFGSLMFTTCISFLFYLIHSYFCHFEDFKLTKTTFIAIECEPATSNYFEYPKRGDNGVAYAWNLREQKWDKIGEVVDGPDDNLRRPVLDGIEYDYVFDVDIGDGEPIRKLPYNRSDNPYATADKWLLKENLPLSYRQQIVEFILQNSGQKDFTLDSSFRDPFTGSSAYIPGATSSMSAAVSAKPTFKHIPKKGVLVFDVAQFDGILKKLTESNNDKENKNLSLTELEFSRLGAIIKVLKDTSLLKF
ncbi:phospholipase A-2-activating protein-like [Quercus lobata]|uniref:phospholipase A-2-activating protein-like n=1 Tax=Quercus lobata TaxID=97700 RepID=UPI0012472C3A|nr:phospholipase A-2-activating protein-like [Quercus lobata]